MRFTRSSFMNGKWNEVSATPMTSRRRLDLPPCVSLYAGIQAKLRPFQIIYWTSSDDPPELDPMIFFSTTRDHLIETEFQSIDGFQSLDFYHSLQNNGPVIFGNGTRVAYRGIAHFANPQNLATVNTNSLMCFLGPNETNYVRRLQEVGWASLRRAQLVTASGEMVEYVDGTMRMMTNETEDADNSMMMMESQQLILFLSVGIPLGICFLALLCWCGRVLWTSLDCESRSQDAWKTRQYRNSDEEMYDSRTSSSWSGGEDLDMPSSLGVAIDERPEPIRIQSRYSKDSDSLNL